MTFILDLLFILSLTPVFSLNGLTVQQHQGVNSSNYRHEIYDSSQCSVLFGNQQARERNRSLRHNNLVSIRRYKHATVIVHHTNWKEPKYLKYSGISLADIKHDKYDDKPVAYIEVTDQLDQFDCDPGLYTIRVDDCIGGKAKVLAILDDMILLEMENNLRYLTNNPNIGKPLWQMVWASRWKIVKTQESSNTSYSRPPSPSPRRHTPPRHRNQGRGRK